MTGTLPRHIVVEGPIGVGKTTLARRLAESFAGALLLEDPAGNPFLERFYLDRRAAALPAQLFFLLQRARQIQELRQNDLFRGTLIADFLLEKDRLFAEVNLEGDELALYEQVYAHLTLDAPSPDLVIYLQAPAEVLQKRVANRGTAYERSIEFRYLEQLVEAYTRFFYHYEDAPLLIVNAAEIDPVRNDADYNGLLEQVRTVRSGRYYFNPLPVVL